MGPFEHRKCEEISCRKCHHWLLEWNRNGRAVGQSDFVGSVQLNCSSESTGTVNWNKNSVESNYRDLLTSYEQGEYLNTKTLILDKTM